MVQLVAYLNAECQILLLGMDVWNQKEGTTMNLFVIWQIIYMSSLILCTCVLPFAYFFYESDEDKGQKQRFCEAFRNNFILLILFSIIHVPMYASMCHSYIPVENKTYEEVGNFDSVFLTLDDQTGAFPESYK